MQSGGGEDGSMYDRAMDALYTPGSTFKVVTLSAALETGTASLTSTYQAPGSMDIGNAPVTNSANESYGTISCSRPSPCRLTSSLARWPTRSAPARSSSLPTPLATVKSSVRT